MHRFSNIAARDASFPLAGCASNAAGKPSPTITLSRDAAGEPAADDDLQKVDDVVVMIRVGHRHLAIDQPLTEVVIRHEKNTQGSRLWSSSATTSLTPSSTPAWARRPRLA